MGGHGHGHTPLKMPDPSIYKVEDVPQLKKLQEELAKRGLEDPWLRNYVWHYKTAPTISQFLFSTIFRGIRIAIPAFLLTIAVEKYFETGKKDHGHEHGHGSEHH